jgi:ubiquinone/menaquinone biosynthesis C-methylase UbiE
MSQDKPSSRTSDFSRIAHRYDATRNIPPHSLQSALGRLIAHGLFPERGVIFDIGCGTGQISLPLAERGYQIRGFDISSEMIEHARSKAAPEWRASFAVADACHLPEADGCADGIVVSKLLQHIEDWQHACHEMIRVARPGASIVHINERAAFGDAVRRHFRHLATELGFARRYIGLDPHSRSELDAFMRALSCEPVHIDMRDIRWDTEISYGEALERIRDGLFAEFWYLPADVHDRIVTDTAAWVAAQPGGAATIDRLSPHLSVQVFRTPDN